MADYISILDKAITGLSENTPENRAIIYSKARAAIEKKLRAMDPLPSEEAIGRQLAQLESAISDVDAKYAPDPEPFIAEPVIPAPELTPAPPVVEPAAVSAPVAAHSVVVPEGFVDDIILIDGIGEKTVSLLADEGVTKISQIAAMSDADLAALTEKIGFKGFELTQEWKAQAASMLGGELPRSKTDQARLEKLREEMAGQAGLSSAQESPAPASEPQSVAEPSEPVAETVASEPVPVPPAPEVSTPSVSAPVVNRPILDNATPSAPSMPADTPSSQPAVPPAPAFEPELPKEPEPLSVQPEIPPSAAPVTAAPAPQATQPANVASAPAEPAFVSQLEGDPVPSPASDPYLERPVRVAPAKKGGAGKAIATGSILLLLGAAAAGAYVYKDQLIELGKEGMTAVQQLIGPKTEPQTAEPSATDSEQPKVEEPKAEETTNEEKDTTRLGSDGTVSEEPLQQSETTSESASSENTETANAGDTGEQEQAEQTLEPTPITPTVEGSDTPATVQVEEEPTSSETAQAETSTEQAAEQPVAALNGEKSFLYEEALGTTGANRDEGSMAWSLAQEAPEDGAEPEAVIKGVLEIPSRGLAMNISIKRNVDAGLPASHIIELFFTAPPEFSGGNVDGVSRFVMKSTEQARGESLVGVPARIDTGFFLIALNNLDQAQQTNLGLLQNAEWVDIPVTYVTGRRALITFEKGASGKAVFEQALADWKNR